MIEEARALLGERPSYPKPWRPAFHLSWFVVDADGGTVAGPFGNVTEANRYIDAWQAWEA